MANLENMSGKYIVLIKENEMGYWGECPELPGCLSAGKSMDQLMRNLEKAIAVFFEENPDFEVMKYDNVAWLDLDSVVTGR